MNRRARQPESVAHADELGLTRAVDCSHLEPAGVRGEEIDQHERRLLSAAETPGSREQRDVARRGGEQPAGGAHAQAAQAARDHDATRDACDAAATRQRPVALGPPKPGDAPRAASPTRLRLGAA